VTSTAKLPQPLTTLSINTRASHYKWLVATIVLIAEGTNTFAGNSINMWVPRLMDQFGTDLTTTQWVSTSFQIARTLVVPILGWLGAMLGMLIGFRLLQRLVLGPMDGITAVILVEAFPVHQRGLALGLRAIGWSVGQVISFTIGGYFIEAISWRLIFLLGVASGIIAAVSGFLVLPRRLDYRSTSIDYLGLMALGSFLWRLSLAISLARYDDTALSTLLLLGLVALLGGMLFILQGLLSPTPAVNLRLFRISTSSLVCCTAFLETLGLFGVVHTLPQTLHEARFVGGIANRIGLGALRRKMDVEAIAAGCRDSDLLIVLFCLFGCILLVSLLVSRQCNSKNPKLAASSTREKLSKERTSIESCNISTRRSTIVPPVIPGRRRKVLLRNETFRGAKIDTITVPSFYSL